MTMTSQMFECRTKPDIPNEAFTDADLATFMVRIVIAHEDCKAQLSTVRNHLEINGVKITEESTPPEEEIRSGFLELF